MTRPPPGSDRLVVILAWIGIVACSFVVWVVVAFAVLRWLG